MQFDVDLGPDSLTRLRRDGADAQLAMCFAPGGADADDGQICFDAFVGVIWPVLLDGLPDLETGTLIVYELEPGVFRVVPANDRIRIELRRDSDSPGRSLVTDLQPFARAVLTEAAAFHRYCQREDIRIGTAWLADLADRLDAARRSSVGWSSAMGAVMGVTGIISSVKFWVQLRRHLLGGYWLPLVVATR